MALISNAKKKDSGCERQEMIVQAGTDLLQRRAFFYLEAAPVDDADAAELKDDGPEQAFANDEIDFPWIVGKPVSVLW